MSKNRPSKSPKKRDQKKAARKRRARLEAARVTPKRFDVPEWFNNNLRPELRKIDSLIRSHNTASDEEAIVKYWWSAFSQNTYCLGYVVGRRECHY